MAVKNLFIKTQHGDNLNIVATLRFDRKGIIGNVACSPMRQVLLTSQSVTAECGLKPGDLRENIVLDFDRLYELPSGTVIKIGGALIRLTFHCEPCRNVLNLVELHRILHKRGFLGCFLNSGSISLGDELSVTDQTCEPIPYAIKDRIRWFLAKRDVLLAANELVHTLGLPSSCARVMPRMLKKLSGTGTRGDDGTNFL